jgi:hypothetical protein
LDSKAVDVGEIECTNYEETNRKQWKISVISVEVEMLISQRKANGNQYYKSSYYEEKNKKKEPLGDQKTEKI